MEKVERESNFELMRLISMFCIVMQHLIIKGADTCGYMAPYSRETDGITGVVMYSAIAFRN